MARHSGFDGLDRRATLDQARRQAESGQITQAIEAYELLALDDPSDWTLRNTLGDLLVRVRQTDRAVQQFLKAAQLQADAGFLAHASGLLKKALRVAPAHSEAKKRLEALNGTRFKRPEQAITPRRTVSAPAAPAVETPAPAASLRTERPAVVAPVAVPAPVERAPVTAAAAARVKRATPVVAAAPRETPARPIAVPALPVPDKLAEPIPVPEPPVSSVPAVPQPVAAVTAKPALPAPAPSRAFVSSMTVLDVRPALVAVSKFVVEPTSQADTVVASSADLDLTAWLDAAGWGGKPGDAPA